MSARGRGRPRRQRIARSLGPARRPVKAGYDAVFAGVLPRIAARRLARSGEPDGEALGRAVRGIAGRGLDDEERDWVRRIEQRRGRLGAREGELELQRPYLPPELRRLRLSYEHIAETASIHRPWGRLLLRLVRELAPASCLELGTAAGISTAYQAAGLELNGRGRLVTIEGSPELSALARETFSELGLERIELRVGIVEELLDEVLDAIAPVELAYLDSGKSRASFEGQIERLLPRLAPRALVVIDDIHWSRELAGAWRDLRRDPRLELATDLWRVGLARAAGH